MATPGKKPGSPKTGGRQKGTPNKNKSEFLELLNEAAAEVAKRSTNPEVKNLAKNGLNPLFELTEIYFELKALGAAAMGPRQEILVKTLEYSYPKKKAVEVSGPDGGAIEVDLGPAADKFNKLAGGL